MILSDLFESMTSEAYHFTSIESALKILSTERFNLTAAYGTKSEKDLQKKGKSFYLSTTRSKVGDYTISNAWSQGVVFTLNSDWFNARYVTKPVDYWTGSSMRMGRHSESEDRVMSDTPTIDFNGKIRSVIKSCHIFVSPDQKRFVRDAVALYRECKKKNVPVFIYDDPKNFALQKKSVSIQKFIEIAKNVQIDTKSYYPRDKKKTIKKWAELVHLDKYDKLSKDTKSMLYYIARGTYQDIYLKDAITGLEADLHNNKRDPEISGKFDKLFKKMGADGVADFVTKISQKWGKILNAG